MISLIAANLGRRRGRTALTALGIAVGVAAIVALISLSEGLSRSAGQLIHLGKADFAVFQGGLADVTASSLPQSLAPSIAAQPGVAAAAPVQLATDQLPGESSFILFGSPRDGFLYKRLVLTAGREAREGEAMVGEVFARRHGVRPGSILPLVHGPVRVAGIYRAGVTFEDGGGVVSLPMAQRLAGSNGTVSLIGVSIRPGYTEDRVAEDIERRFRGTAAIGNPGQAARADTNSLLLSKAAVAMTVLALVIGAVSMTNTMLMSVLERQRELGVLAAVGWPARRIAALIFGEGVAISVLGAGVGVLLGILGSRFAVDALSASDFLSPRVTAWGLGRALFVGIVVGVLGGLYPTWRVTRLDPAAALARE